MSSITERRFENIPLTEFPGYQKLVATNKSFPEMTSQFFRGIPEVSVRAYLPLFGMEDAIAEKSFERLQEFCLGDWKTPHPDFPGYMTVARIDLDQNSLFTGLDISQSREDIDWTSFTYGIEANTVDDDILIEGYVLTIEDEQWRGYATRVEVKLDERGIKVKDKSSFPVVAKQIAQYLYDNPDHTVMLMAKAAMETEKILNDKKVND